MTAEKDIKKQLEKETANEILKDQFIQQVGSKAIVNRSDLENERTDRLREVLVEIGKDLLETGVAPKGMQYRGSLSIHIYASDILRTAAFVGLSETSELPGPLADAALRELTGSTMVKYGKKRQKLRSGF